MEMKPEPPIMPCVDCITMAICNALMHRPEKQKGLNALAIYRRCTAIKDYIDEHCVTQIDENTWKTSFMCIHVYFMKDYYTNPHMVSDEVPLK